MTVLNNRLKLWFKPFKEQAGGQEGRERLEHVAPRLLCYDQKEKVNPLCNTDFYLAYDRVPRDKLLMVLRRLGCVAMYCVTESCIDTAVVLITHSVRQGSLISFLSFMILVDLIRVIKE